jgi:tetratricopeptide (TPR) repeat protein
MAENTNCNKLNPTYTYDLPDSPSGKESLLVVGDDDCKASNCPIYIYLNTHGKCRFVLSSWGSGLNFIKSKISRYPDVIISWHYGGESGPPAGRYVWVGNGYVNAEAAQSDALNKEALRLFNQNNVEEAIKLWKKAIALSIIPGLGSTSNAEALNNLGFAYYKLAITSQSDEHFKLARTYIEQSIEVDPRRWVAYLNLGDLCVAWDWPEEAIKNYEKLLKTNPNYKNATEIRGKIKELNSKIKAK